jgi:hypothetical protein
VTAALYLDSEEPREELDLLTLIRTQQFRGKGKNNTKAIEIGDDESSWYLTAPRNREDTNNFHMIPPFPTPMR